MIKTINSKLTHGILRSSNRPNTSHCNPEMHFIVVKKSKINTNFATTPPLLLCNINIEPVAAIYS